MTPEELMALVAVAGIALIILLVVAIFIFVFAWRVGINAVKGQNTETGAILVTALINLVVNLICGFLPFGMLIYIIVALLVIKSRHETSFLGAIGAFIISMIITLVLIIIAGLIIFAIFAPGLVFLDVIMSFLGL
ncbi:MAG: hypothetical protein GY870_07460 [archaeon]|nr:hypothetical protein [archaeon]